MNVSYSIFIPGCCEDEHGASRCGHPSELIEDGEAIDVEAIVWRVQHLIDEYEFGRCHAVGVEIDGVPQGAEFFGQLRKPWRE